ncbi:MAG: hypothetical protein IT445_06030 [Phycisphaeraceae bacterium]|nr:hypothetical protein [Phycisphaeraceae bacterium]
MLTIRCAMLCLAVLPTLALAESVEVESNKDNAIYCEKPDQTFTNTKWAGKEPLVLEVFNREGKPGNPDANPPIAPDPASQALAYVAFDIAAYKGRITAARLAVCDGRVSRDGVINVALIAVAADWGETADQANPLTWNSATDFGRKNDGDGYGFDPAVVKWVGGVALDSKDFSQVIAVSGRDYSDSLMLHQLNNDEDGQVVFGFFSRYGVSHPIVAREDPDHAGPTLLLEVEPAPAP